MSIYNLTGMNSTESFTGFISFANDLTSGLLMPTIVLIVFSVILIALTLRYDFITSFRVSGITATFVSLGFWGAGLMATQFVLYPAIMVLLSFVFAPLVRSLGEE